MDSEELKELHELAYSASCSARRIEEVAELLTARIEKDPSNLFMLDHDLKDIAQTSEMLCEIYSKMADISNTQLKQ